MIKAINDLGLFGGKPLFEEVLHVGRPNIGSKDKLIERIEEILDRNRLTNNGPMVLEFEKRIMEFLDVRNCVAVCNGTIALEIAVRALGMEDEVIVPSFTFVATAHCLHWQGIKPVFCDIQKDSFNIEPGKIEELITPKTSGILAVNLWGRSADIGGLVQISRKHGLKLLFDSSHSFGCSYSGKLLGRYGDAEVFSFHATKFINSFEGGAVVTENDELAEKIRLMRNFCFSGLDNVIYPGTNGKMSEPCAAMGLTSLESFDEIVGVNAENYGAYLKCLKDLPGIELLEYEEGEKTNYQYIVVTVDSAETGISRDDTVAVLHGENVRARRYFYPGCHRMEPYRSLFPNAGMLLPETTRAAEKVICLPTGTSISTEDVGKICELLSFIAKNGKSISDRLKKQTG